jgi:hypothetical protein
VFGVWCFTLTQNTKHETRDEFVYIRIHLLAPITARLISFITINPMVAQMIPKNGINTMLVKRVPQAAPIRSAENMRIAAELSLPLSASATGN